MVLLSIKSETLLVSILIKHLTVTLDLTVNVRVKCAVIVLLDKCVTMCSVQRSSYVCMTCHEGAEDWLSNCNL